MMCEVGGMMWEGGGLKEFCIDKFIIINFGKVFHNLGEVESQ
jgi:hypothetical protein